MNSRANLGNNAILFLVWATAIDIVIDFGAFHAQDFRVKLDRPLKVIAGQTDMIDSFGFHMRNPPPIGFPMLEREAKFLRKRVTFVSGHSATALFSLCSK